MFDMIPFRKNNSIARRGDELESIFDTFFNDDFFLSTNASGLGKGFKVDLKEDEKNYIVEADLPGVKKENIDISFDKCYLTISAKRGDEVEDKTENYVRREKRYGEFSRSFYIDNADENKINAAFTDGVLKITLPKADPGNSKTKKIDIH